MSYNFFIVGGDKRMCYLSKSLANDGNSVRMLGFDKIGDDYFVNNNIKKVQSINETNGRDIIICSIPLTVDGVNIYTPYGNEKIKIQELKERTIISGNIPQGLKGIDVLKNETVTVLNVIPTVEGAIAKAIEETNITLFNSNVLVMGFGRIGKLLCDRLKGFNANIYCEARKEIDLTWINSYGYRAINLVDLDKNLCKMKIIFNTIPYKILDKERLLLLKKNTTIIDLASKPGGVDYESAVKLGLKVIQYKGIPGKIAPKSCAEYIKNYIYKKINSYDN